MSSLYSRMILIACVFLSFKIFQIAWWCGGSLCGIMYIYMVTASDESYGLEQSLTGVYFGYVIRPQLQAVYKLRPSRKCQIFQDPFQPAFLAAQSRVPGS